MLKQTEEVEVAEEAGGDEDNTDWCSLTILTTGTVGTQEQELLSDSERKHSGSDLTRLRHYFAVSTAKNN